MKFAKLLIYSLLVILLLSNFSFQQEEDSNAASVGTAGRGSEGTFGTGGSTAGSNDRNGKPVESGRGANRTQRAAHSQSRGRSLKVLFNDSQTLEGN